MAKRFHQYGYTYNKVQAQDGQREIAPLKTGAIRDVLATDTTFVSPGKKSNAPAKLAETREAWGEVYKDISLALTSRSNTSTSMLEKTVDSAMALTYGYHGNTSAWGSFAHLQTGYQNYRATINAVDKYFVGMDLETLSGENAVGRNDMFGVSEYSFRVYNGAGKEMADKSLTGLGGLTDEQVRFWEEKLSGITSEADLNSGRFSTQDMVAARWFSRLGHEDAALNWQDDKRVTWKNAVSQDTPGLINQERIRKGLQQAKKIQAFSGDQMAKDIQAGMGYVANGINKANDATMVTHNGLRFDLKKLQQAYAGLGLNTKWDSLRHFDTQTLFHHSSGDMNFSKKFQFGLKPGETPYTLGNIVAKIKGAIGGFDAHTAFGDVGAMMENIIFSKAGRDTVKKAMRSASGSSMHNMSFPIKGDSRVLFKAMQGVQSHQLRQFGVMGFVSDPVTGQLVFQDGTEMSAEGISKGANQYRRAMPLSKGVSYTISQMDQLSSSPAYVKAMRSLYPDAAVDDMIAVHLNPVFDDSVPMSDTLRKQSQERILVGTKQSVEALISKNMAAYATKDANNNWKMLDGARDVVGVYTEGPEGLTSIAETPEDHIRLGTEAHFNDLAARKRREAGSAGFRAFHKIDREVKAIMAKRGVNQQTAINTIVANTSQYAELVATGRPVNLAAQTILGNPNMHPNQLDNLVSAYSYYESMSPVSQRIHEAAARLSGGNRQKYEHLYKAGMLTAQEHGETAGASLRQEARILGKYRANTFSMDVTDLLSKDVRSPDARGNINSVIRAELTPGGSYGLINEVASKMGIDSSEYAKVNLGISKIAKHLQVQYGKKTSAQLDDLVKFAKKSGGKTSTGEMAQRLILAMKELRENVPDAGFLADREEDYVLSDMSHLKDPTLQNDMAERAEAEINRLKDIKAISLKGADKETRERYAQQIVQDHLVDALPEDEVLRTKYGLNPKQIIDTKRIHGVHSEDMKKMMQELLKGVSYTNADLVVSRSANYVGLSHNGKQISLDHLPKVRFKDGGFRTELGNMKVLSNLYASFEGKVADGFSLGVHSNIHNAMQSTFRLSQKVLEKNQENGTSIDLLFSWTKNIAKTLREASSILKNSDQEFRSGHELNVRAIVDALPELLDNGTLNTKTFADADKFIEVFTKEGFNSKKMNDVAKQLWGKNEKEIYRQLANQSSDDTTKTLLSQLIPHAAKSSRKEDFFTRTDEMQFGFEQLTPRGRDVDNQATRGLRFSRDHAEHAAAVLGIKNNVFVHNPLMTSIGHARTALDVKGIGMTDSSVMVKRALMSPAEYAKTLASYKSTATKYEQAIIENILESKNIFEEGAAIADARIQDMAFSGYDVQRINTREKIVEAIAGNESFYSHDALMRHQRLKKVAPKIVFDVNGKASIVEGDRAFVHAGETMFTRELAYGGAKEQVVAKADGYLRRGFFSEEGMRVSYDAVLEHAEKNGHAIHSWNDVLNVTEKMGLKDDYNVERLESPVYRKAVEDYTEKHMTEFVSVAAGKGADAQQGARIAKTLDNIGLSRWKGKILDAEKLEALSNPEILAKYSDMTPEAIHAAIRQGWGSADDFQEAVRSEKYEASVLMERIFGAKVLSGSDTVKHKNIFSPYETGLRTMLANRMQAGQTASEAAKEVHGLVGDAFNGGLSFDGEKIVVNDLSRESGHAIDMNKLGSILDKDLGEGNWGDWHNFSVIGDDPTNITAVGTGYKKKGYAYGSNEKGAKLSLREINMLRMERFNDAIKKNIEAIPDNLFPERNLLADLEEGSYMHSGILDQAKKQQFFRYDDGPDLMESDSLSKREAYLAKIAERQGIGALGERSAQMMYEASMAAKATHFNAGKFGAEVDAVNRITNVGEELNRFHVVKIDDLIRTRDMSSDFYSALTEGNYLDKNLLIDLHGEHAPKDGRRFLAFSAIGAGAAGGGDIIAEKGPVSQLNALLGTYQNIKNGAYESSEVSADKYAAAAENVVKAVNNYATGKEGLFRQMSDITMAFSARGKAGVMDAAEMTRYSSGMLERLSFDGMSLADHYRDGRHIGFQVMSEDMARKMMAGLPEDEITKNLETMRSSGLAGYGMRQPSIYRGSESSVMMYVDDSVRGNQVLESLGTALRRKADSDGDTIASMLARFLGPRADEDYAKHKAMVYQDAMETNKYMEAWHKNISIIDQANDVIRHRMGDDLVSYEHEKVLEGKVQKLRETTLFGNYLFGNGGAELSEQEMNEIRDTHSQLMRHVSEKNLTTEEGRKAFRSLDERAKMLNESVKELGGDNPEEIRRFAQAAAYEVGSVHDLSTSMSKLKRSAAGEISLPIYEMQKLRSMLITGGQEEGILGVAGTKAAQAHRDMADVMEAMEEGFLTPKHAEDLVDHNLIMEEFHDSIKSLTGAGDRERSAEPLRKWINDYAKGKIRGHSEEELGGLVDKTVNAMYNMFNSTQNKGEFNTFLNQLGAYKNGVPMDSIDRIYSVPSEAAGDPMGRTMRFSAEIAEMELRQKEIFKRSTKAAEGAMSDGAEQAEAAFVKGAERMSSGVAEGVGRALNGGSGMGKIALGALATMAGAIVTAGYVGGNPSNPEPAPVQQQPPQAPQLAKPLATQAPSLNGGYLININATSSNKNMASAAIHQSMLGVGFNNVNVSMNIKDDTERNITNSRVQNAMMGVLQ